MEIDKSTQPVIGTWTNLPTEEIERKPKMDFDVGVRYVVTFLEEEPAERTGENGVYYIFNVVYGEEERVIMTGAWTLLRGLKVLTPIKGKTVAIKKTMEKGKQIFHVEEVKTGN